LSINIFLFLLYNISFHSISKINFTMDVLTLPYPSPTFTALINGDIKTLWKFNEEKINEEEDDDDEEEEEVEKEDKKKTE